MSPRLISTPMKSLVSPREASIASASLFSGSSKKEVKDRRSVHLKAREVRQCRPCRLIDTRPFFKSRRWGSRDNTETEIEGRGTAWSTAPFSGDESAFYVSQHSNHRHNPRKSPLCRSATDCERRSRRFCDRCQLLGEYPHRQTLMSPREGEIDKFI